MSAPCTWEEIESGEVGPRTFTLRTMARRIGEVEFNALYHQGNGSHIFMNSIDDETIMIAVFGSFILNPDPTVKQFGVGLSVGVALAALTVLAFAPAMLVLAGKGSWWLPGWLDRVLPHMDVEGTGAEAAPKLPAAHADVGS